ncbi:MAG: prepilin-type N-terminal cleavage/methylation domain-containing protein [Ruminiclostridium sp.]|nr:prepilin-type N-terminal cleavage/methylation domain-containing protein [Ruminiclostridium sp.]
MLKYLMKLRHRKAFTLVELVIVMAILAVLMVSVAAFSTPVQQMIKATAADADALSANKIMGDYIENRLAYADMVQLFYTADSLNGSTDLEAAYTVYQQKLDPATNPDTSAADFAGMLIFRFVEDTVEPSKSKYMMYDVNIPSSGGSFASAVGTSTNPKGAVFTDFFYDNSQNLFLFPTTAQTNVIKDCCYMTVDIVPYKFDPEETTDFITSTTLQSYYSEKLAHESDPASNPSVSPTVEGFRGQRSGAQESVTFEFKNISPAKMPSKITYSNPGGDGGGSDIVIFYYIKKY